MTRLALELKGDTHEHTISGESFYRVALGRILRELHAKLAALDEAVGG